MSKRTQRGEIRRNYGKDSALAMAGKGLKSWMSDPKKSLRKPGLHSRSYAPKTLNMFEDTQEAIGITAEEAIAADEFFDEVIATSMYSKPSLPRATLPPIAPTPKYANVDQSAYEKKKGPVKRKQVSPVTSPDTSKTSQDGGSSWNMSRKREKPNLKKAKAEAQGQNVDDDDGIDMPDWVESLWDNSDRHAAGFSLVEKFFGSPSNKHQERRRSRPYFTYWVTIVQIILYIVSIAYYGIAPIGTSKTSISAEVLMTNLAIENVAYDELDNLWIGPTQADLIHMGAKYSPCMRKDENINAALEYDREKEKEQACCVYNDGSGCVMTDQGDCSGALATWFNWTESNPGPDGRLSGAVCGQDPEFCTNPASTGAYQWQDDFTQWPICEETDVPASGRKKYNMMCEVVGRPCCVGIRGECIVATREYCDFRKGYFHENASVCSQVECMNEICAMIDFTDPSEPDQFYRFFTSLFLSSGILSLVISLVFQLTIQRDLEKLIGVWPMTVLFLGGGVVGSLASATFIPYYVEAGASGSQFAVIAAMFLEVMRWNKDENPGKTIGKIIFVLFVLFLLGAVVASIDNFAHLFGLIFGFFVAFGFRPFRTRGGKPIPKGCIIFSQIVMFLCAIGLFAMLVVIYYVLPVTNCESCMYFNCIPFTSTYCDGMSVNIKRDGQTVVRDA